ncbi:hypothetical protein BDI4_580074 [Burkholderia diffusa]|nr:hypothetical protein BDI4_580074 [Burkholderia diffusa]
MAQPSDAMMFAMDIDTLIDTDPNHADSTCINIARNLTHPEFRE